MLFFLHRRGYYHITCCTTTVFDLEICSSHEDYGMKTENESYPSSLDTSMSPEWAYVMLVCCQCCRMPSKTHTSSAAHRGSLLLCTQHSILRSARRSTDRHYQYYYSKVRHKKKNTHSFEERTRVTCTTARVNSATRGMLECESVHPPTVGAHTALSHTEWGTACSANCKTQNAEQAANGNYLPTHDGKNQ